MSTTPIHRFARAASVDDEKAPPIQVRFFYASPLPIDDPLSPVPPPLTSASAPFNLAPRPFSEYDNTALDRAWNELRRKILKYKEDKDVEKVSETYSRIGERQEAGRSIQGLRRSPVNGVTNTPPGSRRGTIAKGVPGMARIQELVQQPSRNTREESSQAGRFRSSSLRGTLGVVESSSPDSGSISDSGNQGLTGMPFARAPSRKTIYMTESSPKRSPSRTGRSERHLITDDYEFNRPEDEKTSDSRRESVSEPLAKVPVGVSRLHQVSMPALQMEPIYWSPVHDIATVIRGTWFYKDSMLPVEVEVANMLEAGYMALRPWTETWNDELNSAVEVGAVGEMKIAHPLWPEPAAVNTGSRPGTSSSTRITLDEGTPESKREEVVKMACDIIDTMASPDHSDAKAAGSMLFGKDGKKRVYLGSSVIYANEREAYILRPNLQPSSYYGRRPFANYIRKGRSIGVAVTRGFHQDIWDKWNPPKTGDIAAAAQDGVSTSQAGQPLYRRMQSDPALSRASRPRVTDLILVIHGIGQKLSERVESFHFTHAMNSFRREVNVDLGTAAVKMHLREEMGGIMLLPVNWRSSLSFEEGGYRDGPDETSLGQNAYTLKDITPETLPNVRNIITDVMLDIPYYLSHHQPTMIAAVIREANRIYELWCLNNPGFEQYGRVHLIAHSLGSVMALDILSKQPTSIQPRKPGEEVDRNPQHFTFDTKNLYLCGSPAGFFLLLKKASLLPREGRNKPSADGEDATPGVAGEEGTYGCIAVDNIYNVINPYDPVTYRINATVDATYAASLKSTFIPSANTSWFAFGNPFRGSATAAAAVASTKKPNAPLRLPSNVELETHNFTQEEIAEKRFYLLNDNGQIDFFLRYGGGPLEIQYLTMLGAHSSYWISKDFVRFVVVETGRKLGREGALQAVKAVKKKGAFAG